MLKKLLKNHGAKQIQLLAGTRNARSVLKFYLTNFLHHVKSKEITITFIHKIVQDNVRVVRVVVCDVYSIYARYGDVTSKYSYRHIHNEIICMYVFSFCSQAMRGPYSQTISYMIREEKISLTCCLYICCDEKKLLN